MKLVSLTLTAMIVGLILVSTPLAQDEKAQIPSKGSTNYATSYTFRKLTDLEMEGTGSAWVTEILGITRNTDGKPYFDQMSVRCVGYAQVVDEETTYYGACVETDKDGDQVYTTYDMEAHYLVGGTGKYVGISGKAPFRSTTLKSIGPNIDAGIVDHAVTWEFK